MRILCIGYREWALEIYKGLRESRDCEILISGLNGTFDPLLIENINPDLLLFYGWSSIIPSHVLKSYTCLMLHPSRLPEFRGGSPIQNQIIRGIKDSAVTIFKMTDVVDGGPIARQADLKLEGDIDNIFSNIIRIGLQLTQDIIANGLQLMPQDSTHSSFYKRRLPSESEITTEEIRMASSEYLLNKIRMLTGPYPRAYITTSDGKKLYIEKAFLGD